jgi:hypothetical protein
MKNNKSTKTKKAKDNPCEKYELAITNFVLGEDMGMTKDELFEHLKGCKNCRRDLTEWQDTYTVMRMESFSKTPEGKAKMQQDLAKLKERMKRESLPTPIGKEIPIDVKWEIGSAAGKVYDLLKTKGKLSIPVIVKYTGLKEYNVQQGIGWLAGQEKILLSRDDKTAYASLNPGV